MKKLLALLLALLTVFAFSACSEDANGGDENDQYKKDDTVITEVTMKNGDTFHFTNVDSESVIITKFESTEDVAHEVVIPSHLDGKAVVAIGQEAFAGCSNISKITFPTPADFVLAEPDFVIAKYSMTIEPFAFRNCDALTTISIPNYVTEIGESAFYGCISLNEVVLPADSKLETLAHSLFMECEVLSSIVIPASVRTIEQGAFFGCTALKTVDFAEGTTMIVKQAFQNCKSLEEVILPSSLVTIGTQAFSGAENLIKVTYNGTSKEVLAYIDTLNLPEVPETPETPEIPETPEV